MDASKIIEMKIFDTAIDEELASWLAQRGFEEIARDNDSVTFRKQFVLLVVSYASFEKIFAVWVGNTERLVCLEQPTLQNCFGVTDSFTQDSVEAFLLDVRKFLEMFGLKILDADEKCLSDLFRCQDKLSDEYTASVRRHRF